MIKNSGYAAVHEDLISSPEVGILIEDLIKHTKEASLISYNFRIHTGGDDIAETQTVWSYLVGSRIRQFDNDVYTKLYIDVQDQVTEAASLHIIDQNFGVKGRVGTRNCQRDVLINGRSASGSYGTKSRRVYVQSFNSFLREYVGRNSQLQVAAEKSQNRLVGEMIAICESEEFAKRKQEELCKQAQVDILRTLKKYRNVPRSVLNEAISLACIDEIMET